MSEEKGAISVNTENLFPIIKKWLYSEHDIFLRELVSNSVDAITKLDRLSGLGEYKGEIKESFVDIKIDKKEKTIIVSDNGLGMSRDEVKKYINQIAFSGAKDFLEQYKEGDSGSQIIGHFGLGFFSSFMVSDLVEIISRSYQENEAAVHWKCDGSTEFSLEDSDKKDRGTDVILHINAESEDFLDEQKIKDLVVRFSNFLPVEIRVNGKKANEQSALWNSKPAEDKEQEYLDFYQKLFPFGEDPLFHVHFTVDYPFNLKGILYFPKIRTDIDIKSQGRIKLFCNNVFVSDNIIDIIPPYLNLLQGVIDSPDIPLNVSRSFLQGDPKVKKIGSHIVNKVADRLVTLLKNKREKYAEYWEHIHVFIKFGCINDEKFFEKMKEGIIFKTVEGKVKTIREYQDDNSKLKNKIIYCSDKDAQVSYINSIKNEEVEIAVFDSPIDSHLLQHLEMKMSPLRFVRVDSDIGEKLLAEDDHKKKDEEQKKRDEQFKELISLFKHHLEKEHLDIHADTFKDTSFAAMITLSEQMRRFSDMSFMMGGKAGSGLPDFHTLIINVENEVIKKITNLQKTDANGEQVKMLCKNVYDLALLQQNNLKGDALADFVKRATALINQGV